MIKPQNNAQHLFPNLLDRFGLEKFDFDLNNQNILEILSMILRFEALFVFRISLFLRCLNRIIKSGCFFLNIKLIQKEIAAFNIL